MPPAFGVAMQPGDRSFCTYRGHAHTLARGVPMERVLGELMGRDNGLMRGKGGSMHLTSVEHGVMGSYAIIGAHLPIACGAAWRAQYRGSRGCVRLLLRRRHHQHRRVPRSAELRRDLEAAGGLRLREQPLHGIHADRRRDRGGASGGRPRLGLRPREDRHRRQRCRRRLPHGAARRIAKARARRRAVADRVPDLPPFRPLPRRSGEVPPARANWRSGWSATRSRSTASACSNSASPRTPWRRSRPKASARSKTATEACKASPPTPDGHSDQPMSMPMEAGHGGTDLSRRGGRGIAQEMERDENVVFLGEDVAKAGGVFKATVGLLREVRPEARARHADFRAGDPRRGDGRGDDGPAARSPKSCSRISSRCASTSSPTRFPRSRYMTNGQMRLPAGDAHRQRRRRRASARSIRSRSRTGR